MDSKKRIILPDGSVTTIEEVLANLVDLTGDQQFDVFIMTILDEFNSLREEADNLYEMARENSEATKEFNYMNVQAKALTLKMKALEKAADVIKMVTNYKIQLSKQAIVNTIAEPVNNKPADNNVLNNLLRIVDGGKQ